MCGITGFIDFTATASRELLQSVAQRMADSLCHRGPDDEGVWVDAEAGVALGHRRLSIIDLSPHGHQPMLSADGRYVVAFNGEIYNYLEIRKELEDTGAVPNWRGQSDTEVLLAAVGKWGVSCAVTRFVGMFAFALYDRRERVLHLVRDRMGEKPLYYGWMGKTCLFGSELKALRAHPAWNGEIDPNALALLMRHNYVPSPFSIYKNVFKLPAGSVLNIKVFPSERWEDNRTCLPERYWDAKAIAEQGCLNRFPGTETEAVERLDGLLRASVKGQMIADVPLGAFLSGGIDSSTVVALMQQQSDRPVRTFTIGFAQDGYNEAKDARTVATHLGTDHTELYVTPEQAMEVIPLLSTLYDEPFSDSSQIPTFLIAQLARTQVTVALSGDGGDELFAGYPRYALGRRLWKRIGWMPNAGRRRLVQGIRKWSPGQWNASFSWLGPLLFPGRNSRLFGDKLYKLAALLDFRSPEVLYRDLVSHWRAAEGLVHGEDGEASTGFGGREWADLPDFTHRMMFWDMVRYLPDDILVKVDRAAMGVSLETRIPLLDHRVVEFAWQIPTSMKVRNAQDKWLLRQVLYRYVPKDLVERPKMGFGIPIDSWLRGPLRDWAESLLNERKIRESGYLNPKPVRQKWEEHLSGARNWHYHLWDVLMFQAWLEAQRG